MSDRPNQVSAPLGLRYIQSLGVMKVTMRYITPKEQLETQHYCVWFYKHGAGRVQTSINLAPPCFFTDFSGGILDANVISVALSGQVIRLTCDDSSINHDGWFSVQVKPMEIFQLRTTYDKSNECRMVKVLRNNKYTVTARANADTKRLYAALAKGTGGVLAIAGADSGTDTVLSTVSSYDIDSDTWEGL